MSFAPYAADPNHLWNRVYRALFVRHDAQGRAWGCDQVDPLLWMESRHILAPFAYKQTVSLLDEFISTDAGQLVRDPSRRALFQHDLWAVFNWLALRSDDHRRERTELESRLATIIKSVALTPSEIRGLPDDFATLRLSNLSGNMALPNPADGWVLVGRDDGLPAALVHSIAFPRSLFLVYMKLPSGEEKTSDYVEAMRTYSRERPKSDCLAIPCNPPQFPVGTEVALVRQAILINDSGHPVISPITESIQLRLYKKIAVDSAFDFDGSAQQVAEFQLTRQRLAAGKLQLRRVGEDEIDFPVFSTHGMDAFEDPSPPFRTGGNTIQGCRACHQGTGVRSFTSYSRLQFEREHLFVLVHETTEKQEEAAAIRNLQNRDDWKLLQRMMR